MTDVNLSALSLTIAVGILQALNICRDRPMSSFECCAHSTTRASMAAAKSFLDLHSKLSREVFVKNKVQSILPVGHRGR